MTRSAQFADVRWMEFPRKDKRQQRRTHRRIAANIRRHDAVEAYNEARRSA